MSFFAELKRRNVVRVGIAYALIGWVLVQIGEAVLPAFEVPDGVLRGLVILLLLGLPAVLVFAWVFEMTPEGIKREKDVVRDESITSVTGRKLDRIIIGVLVVAVAVLAWQLNARDGAPAERSAAADATRTGGAPAQAGGVADSQPSVAVLPFVNMSDDPSNEYFSEGISEELLNVLVKVDGIRVASRTSSFAFKDKEVSIPEIAKQLKVDHVVEGSVRKAGNQVRVTAQLIDVASDRHLWSQTYDRELKDIFAIQDEITGHIVEALQVALGAGEAREMAEAGKPTEDLDAYQFYLQGRYFWQRRGEANIRKAIDLLQRAIDADPGFARAWAGLAAAYITLPTYSNEPWAENYAKARRAAERALALDDSQADAYAVLGDIGRSENNWEGAEQAYLAAIEREPKNATAHLWYAEFLQVTGRLGEAMRHDEIAYELDPLSPGTNVNLAGTYLALGRNDDARRLAEAALELGHPFASQILGTLELTLGNYDQAIARFKAFESAVGLPVPIDSGLVDAMRRGGREAAVAYVQSVKDQVRPVAAFWALGFAGAGDDAVAFALEHPDELGGNDWFVFWDQAGRSIRTSPRFAELVTRLGMMDYWRKNGWPDFCQPEGDGIACR